MNINNFPGDQADVSAEKEPLMSEQSVQSVQSELIEDNTHRVEGNRCENVASIWGDRWLGLHDTRADDDCGEYVVCTIMER